MTWWCDIDLGLDNSACEHKMRILTFISLAAKAPLGEVSFEVLRTDLQLETDSETEMLVIDGKRSEVEFEEAYVSLCSTVYLVAHVLLKLVMGCLLCLCVASKWCLWWLSLPAAPSFSCIAFLESCLCGGNLYLRCNPCVCLAYPS